VTELMVRPTASTDDDRKSSDDDASDRHLGARLRVPLLAGVLAAVAAAALGLAVVEVLVTVLGLADGRSQATFGQALHVGAALWLLAHGASVHFAEGWVSLVPLGLTAAPAFLLHRAGREVGRRCSRHRAAVATVAAIVALPYALALFVIGLLAGNDPTGPAAVAWQAAIGGVVLALPVVALGAAGVLAPDRLAFLHRGGRVLRLSGPEPAVVRVVLRGALVACGALLAGAALLLAVFVSVNISAAGQVAQDTSGGVVSATGVWVVQLALLPNLIMWFVAYSTGPGFSVGSDTVLTPFEGRLGEVPALPVFGGLPGHLPFVLAAAVLVVPTLAGVLAGRVVVGRLGQRSGWATAGLAAACGPVAGLILGALVALASGQVLGGNLRDVGASALETGLAVSLEVGLVAAAVAALTRAARKRRVERASRPASGGGLRGPAAPASRRGDDDSSGAHRRVAPRTPRRRPSWLRAPSWLRVPSRLRSPSRLRRRSRLRAPSGSRRPTRFAGRWWRRRREVVRLPD
jgi:hypothetical protein